MLTRISLISFLIFILAGCGQTDRNIGKSTSDKKLNPTIADYIEGKDYGKYQVATFAGGCFWCTEAAFERINGVVDVISGYAGGKEPPPTYQEIGTGTTGHTESIQIYFDPNTINFAQLLEVFFVAHDPTQLNRQGPDVGPQYRSAIFYHNNEQKQQIDKTISNLTNTQVFARPIVTEIAPYTEFWVAESYHQDYYEHNPGNPYVQKVSKPKVEKVKKQFAEWLKPKYQ